MILVTCRIALTGKGGGKPAVVEGEIERFTLERRSGIGSGEREQLE